MVTTTAMAQPKPECKDVIAACDKALEDKNKALTLANLAITNCIKHGTNVQLQLNEKTDELNRWYRQPLIVGIIGVLVGGVAYSLLENKAK